MITGKQLIAWGYPPGTYFKDALPAANAAWEAGGDEAAIRAAVDQHLPPPTIPLRAPGDIDYFRNIEAADDDDAANIISVDATMTDLMRTPTIKAGAVMPDACPAGPKGTIPVGGVVAAENAIHPGFHSADICCSVLVSVFGDVDPVKVMDLGMERTHFGGGGRRDARLPAPAVLAAFEANPFLAGLEDAAHDHFGTQGDGNHFFYVGRIKSSGDIALVTHHGSRKPGAMLYKRGMQAAERHRMKTSPETLKHNAWIPADTREGEDYWAALQLIRTWTKGNHEAIHELVRDGLGVQLKDRFWNEHNFVFRRDDGLFYHGKGATPAWDGFAADSNGLTLIPLNMAEPILIARGKDADNGLGFSPHGAGRNWGRKAHVRRLGEHDPGDVIARETEGLDVRFWCGVHDLSELPSAYKNADAVRAQIEQFDLAEVVDLIEPIGTIMAGDWLGPYLEERRAGRR